MSNRLQIATKRTTTPQSSGILQRKCACGGGGSGCAECEEKREMLQRSAGGSRAAASVPPIVHDVLRSPGKPLDQGTRSFFEPRFGHDFSRVRVHADAPSAESARSVNALAYTVGRDIVFDNGRYAPQTAHGQRLLAHELTHVVQQGDSISRLPSRISSPTDHSEHQAARTTDEVVAGGPVPALSTSSSLLQRQAAGGGGAAPAAETLDGLKAIRINFKTAGALDPHNCTLVPPPALGVGILGNAENAMEMTYRLDGPIPAGTEFDILRTRTNTEWQRNAAGAWARLHHDPMGTNDDHTNDDECLTPTADRHIFVIDQPGFEPGLNPRGIGVDGVNVDANATAFAAKNSFAEWVIARNRRLGIPFRVISDPTFTFWHSVTSVALVGGVWNLANTPNGDANQIGLGSISVAGALP